MKFRLLFPTLLVTAASFFSGCSTTALQPPLRVGVTADMPPIIAKANGAIVGLEADFARNLAHELGRPLKFVELKWKEQVPALLTGQIDIIMSGMSVTEVREVRVDFCDSYMKSGLMALIRTKDTPEFKTLDALHRSDKRLGVKRGTTADTYAQENFRSAHLMHYDFPEDAALALRNRTLDIFIHDAPSILWLASKYEADLTPSPVKLTEEAIAWAVSPHNPGLKAEANRILAGWKQNGALQQMLARWVPGASAE